MTFCILGYNQGRGSQIWIGLGCAAGSSRPIPMFRGNFSKNRYPYLGIFLEKRYPFVVILQQKHNDKILKIRLIARDFFMKNAWGKWDPCLGISCKKTTYFGGTSLYVLTCEYPPYKVFWDILFHHSNRKWITFPTSRVPDLWFKSHGIVRKYRVYKTSENGLVFSKLCMHSCRVCTPFVEQDCAGGTHLKGGMEMCGPQDASPAIHKTPS